MKKDYFSYIFGSIFSIVGLILIIICICVTMSGIKFDETAVEIKGTIVNIESYRDADGDRHREVFVDYEYEGKRFTNVKLNSHTNGMYEGNEIALKIDPENPGRVRTLHGNKILSILLGIMGGVFLLVGITTAVTNAKKEAKKKQLRQQGRYINAIVERVDVNYNYSVNGKHPFVLYCNYQDEYSGVVYKFKSDNLWTNPYPFLQQGSEVRVLVNGQDYSQYYVDVESSLQGKVVDFT